MDWGYQLGRAIAGVYRALFIRRIDVRGLEKLPPGPKIIVANHANASDSFALPFVLKEKLHFVIQGSAFDLPVLGRLLELAEQVPCYARQGLEMIRHAQEKLARGGCVVIYPEGKLNNNEGLLKAGLGAAMLALKSRAPVVPLGFYVLKKDLLVVKWNVFRDYVSRGGWQWRGACALRFGEPIVVGGVDETGRQPVHLRKATAEIMARVAQLVEDARRDLEGLSPELGEPPAAAQQG
jgi:1-acyl-sn-glycerol-3-phosphate acyltransferase